MKLSKLLLLALLGALLFLAPYVRAQDEAAAAADEGEEEVTAAEVEEEVTEGDEEVSETGAVPVVETAVFFPDYQDKKFPIGERVTMLALVKNAGEEPFQLTSIAAHLHSVFDLNYYVQNFTVRELGVVVEPHREVSLEYFFFPDRSLEPLEFHFSADIEYNSTSGEVYRKTIFSSTVELFDKPQPWDFQSFLSYLFGTGIVIAACYFGYLTFRSEKPSRSGRGKTSAASSASKPSSSGKGKESEKPEREPKELDIDEWAGPIYKAKPVPQKKKPSKSR